MSCSSLTASTQNTLISSAFFVVLLNIRHMIVSIRPGLSVGVGLRCRKVCNWFLLCSQDHTFFIGSPAGDDVVYLRRLHSVHPSNSDFKRLIAFVSGKCYAYNVGSVLDLAGVGKRVH